MAMVASVRVGEVAPQSRVVRGVESCIRACRGGLVVL